ncbi:hypothetical protein NPIL_338362 [Nephila pilipes]|uniref:Uncharacterized protein n=1 Tax=Nephila pilipes TaxID=299642 RepID=A0A8X6PVN6_NEPPI|nr:hypothetical protein NPIL_338362 [Nephila pilipes]
MSTVDMVDLDCKNRKIDREDSDYSDASYDTISEYTDEDEYRYLDNPYFDNKEPSLHKKLKYRRKILKKRKKIRRKGHPIHKMLKFRNRIFMKKGKKIRMVDKRANKSATKGRSKERRDVSP